MPQLSSHAHASIRTPHAVAIARRLVIKIGSAVLTHDGHPDVVVIGRIAEQIAVARSRGVDVLIVASGAVASGFDALGLPGPPKRSAERRAAAAIGQVRVMRAFGDAFASHGVCVAQLLITPDDVARRERAVATGGTIDALFARGIVPIVNENDPMAGACGFGCNDRLAAQVAVLVGANLLLGLSSVDGMLGPDGCVIREVTNAALARSHVFSATSATGTGGMASKVEAAVIAASAGVETVVAGGRRGRVVLDALEGMSVGTRFAATAAPVRARRRWLGVSAPLRGAIVVDDGARRAIIERRASLLPAGIIELDGAFDVGEAVEIRHGETGTFARGIVSYAASEVARLVGCHSSRIGTILGRPTARTVVRRDDLFVLPEAS